MEASQLKFLFIPFVLLLGCKPSEPRWSPSSANPPESVLENVWIGQQGNLGILLYLKDFDPALSAFRAPKEKNLLELKEPQGLYQIFLCNFSNQETLRISAVISSELARLTALPEKPPTTELGKLLWRSLGGGIGDFSLKPQESAQLVLLGPVQGVDPIRFSLQLGETRVEMQRKKAPRDVLEEFALKPSLSLFKEIL